MRRNAVIGGLDASATSRRTTLSNAVGLTPLISMSTTRPTTALKPSLLKKTAAATPNRSVRFEMASCSAVGAVNSNGTVVDDLFRISEGAEEGLLAGRESATEDKSRGKTCGEWKTLREWGDMNAVSNRLTHVGPLFLLPLALSFLLSGISDRAQREDKKYSFNLFFSTAASWPSPATPTCNRQFCPPLANGKGLDVCG